MRFKLRYSFKRPYTCRSKHKVYGELPNTKLKKRKKLRAKTGAAVVVLSLALARFVYPMLFSSPKPHADMIEAEPGITVDASVGSLNMFPCFMCTHHLYLLVDSIFSFFILLCVKLSDFSNTIERSEGSSTTVNGFKTEICTIACWSYVIVVYNSSLFGRAANALVYPRVRPYVSVCNSSLFGKTANARCPLSPSQRGTR